MPLTQLKRTLEFSTPGTSLYVRHEQLMISRQGEGTVSVPLEDIGVVVLDEARCNITQSVLAKFASSSIALVVSNSKHLPVGILLPTGTHSSLVSIQKLQMQVSAPRKKRLWQDIVRAKVIMQASVLRHFNNSDCGVESMAKRVLSGDTSNIEAQAAQKYWKELFGKEFRRDRELEGLNALLNYGYAILRATIARSIVASGLLSSLGLHHHNRSNAFCLADDLMEPFRPIVDKRVKELNKNHQACDEELPLQDRSVRASLLALLGEPIYLNGSVTPLGVGVSFTVSSLKKCFADRSEKLILPTTIFDGEHYMPVPLRADRNGPIVSQGAPLERSSSD